MKTLNALVVVVCVSLLTLSATAKARKARPDRPLVQIAILLDTSSSMDGLIDQAKTQLWKIVNELIASKKNGRRPQVEVALLEYGKQSLPRKDGYIRVIQPLTTNLDKVSEELFALRTNGGDEYCGQVMQVATRELAWSRRPGDLKVMVIAGNEPFNQGPVSYKVAARQAIARGIMVDTIFCGNARTGIQTHWKEGAMLADGHYLAIDHNRRVPRIAAPQDAEIARLGQELNKTYIAYGRKGKAAKMRQRRQDTNAAGAAPSAMAERAVYKSSGAYDNADWDLADAVRSEKVDVAEMEDDALPEEMRGMDERERKAHVAAQLAKRTAIQKKIQRLNRERRKYLAQKRKELASSGGETLDTAMLTAIRKQAEQKKFQFE